MIIPVIDLKEGVAVSGKSGMRKTYKPLETLFHSSSDPVAIAIALKDAGARMMYVADLDAIEKTGSNLQIVSQMNHIIPVMLDAGIGNVEDVLKVSDAADKVIIATETLESLDKLEEIFMIFPREDLVVSVDVKDGQLLGKHIKTDFDEVIKKIADLKPLEVIVLDMSRVGTESGADYSIIKKFKDIDTSMIFGGGLRDSDILELQKRGVNKFLIGTALHAGTFKHPL